MRPLQIEEGDAEKDTGSIYMNFPLGNWENEDNIPRHGANQKVCPEMQDLYLFGAEVQEQRRGLLTRAASSPS